MIHFLPNKKALRSKRKTVAVPLHLVEIQEPFHQRHGSRQIEPVFTRVNSRRRLSWGKHDSYFLPGDSCIPRACAVGVDVKGGARAGRTSNEPGVIRTLLITQHRKQVILGMVRHSSGGRPISSTKTFYLISMCRING